MFKVTPQNLEIDSQEQIELADKFLLETGVHGEYLCFRFRYSMDEFRKAHFFYDYETVESTGFHLPVYYGRLFWLDTEAGFIYTSLYSNPFYVPLFNLKKFIQDAGYIWDEFLSACMEIFTPKSGIKITDMDEFFQSSLSYESSKSLAFNFFKFSKEGDTTAVDSSFDKFLTLFAIFYKDRDFDVLNPYGFLGEKQIKFHLQERNFDYELLENSFQSSILKDLVGALGGETSMDSVVEKAQDSGLLQAMKSDVSRFNTVFASHFLSGFNMPKSASIEKVGSNRLILFPYDIVTNQIAKLVRRFKLKGII